MLQLVLFCAYYMYALCCQSTLYAVKHTPLFMTNKTTFLYLGSI